MVDPIALSQYKCGDCDRKEPAIVITVNTVEKRY